MYRAKEKQMSIYDYLPPYHGELRDKNRWVRLAEAIDWDRFEQGYSELFAPSGKAAISARIALGCRVIQLHYEVSDTFSDEMPFSARTVARFRARIPDKVVRPAVRLLRSFV